MFAVYLGMYNGSKHMTNTFLHLAVCSAVSHQGHLPSEYKYSVNIIGVSIFLLQRNS